jgi:hypothetical protein
VNVDIDDPSGINQVISAVIANDLIQLYTEQ